MVLLLFGPCTFLPSILSSTFAIIELFCRHVSVSSSAFHMLGTWSRIYSDSLAWKTSAETARRHQHFETGRQIPTMSSCSSAFFATASLACFLDDALRSAARCAWRMRTGRQHARCVPVVSSGRVRGEFSENTFTNNPQSSHRKILSHTFCRTLYNRSE